MKLPMQLVREQDWNKGLVSDLEVELSRVVWGGWEGRKSVFDMIQYFQ